MIDTEEFVERLCRVGADRGPRRFPRKRRDAEILVKSILMLLDSSAEYAEREINRVLQEWKHGVAPAIHTDHVTLRRMLIDGGYLERTADGSRYRVGFPVGFAAFDLEVDDIDLRSTVAAYLDHQQRERQKRRQTRPS
jgi:hypothetical protein